MVRATGLIVLDDTLVKPNPTSSIKHYTVPATEKAIKELKSQMAANIILLAATNSIGQLVSRTSLEESIKSTVPPRFVELNLRALQIGFDLAENHR